MIGGACVNLLKENFYRFRNFQFTIFCNGRYISGFSNVKDISVFILL